jgi:hypothetical protein
MTQLNFSNKTTFYQLKGDLQLSIAVVIILDEMAFGPRVPTLSTHFEANLREAYRKEGKNDFITRDIAYLVKNGIVTILDWNKLTDDQKGTYSHSLANILDGMAGIAPVSLFTSNPRDHGTRNSRSTWFSLYFTFFFLFWCWHLWFGGESWKESQFGIGL